MPRKPRIFPEVFFPANSAFGYDRHQSGWLALHVFGFLSFASLFGLREQSSCLHSSSLLGLYWCAGRSEMSYMVTENIFFVWVPTVEAAVVNTCLFATMHFAAIKTLRKCQML